MILVILVILVNPAILANLVILVILLILVNLVNLAIPANLVILVILMILVFYGGSSDSGESGNSAIIVFDILESYHFRKYGTCWVF